MRIIFNCINNIVGGGVQNAANFIFYAVKDRSNDYVFLVSPNVHEVLVSWGIEHDGIFVFEDRRDFFSIRRKVRLIEKKFSPDLVFTMAGPSYTSFKTFHILGTSDPYITHAKAHLFFFQKTVFQGLRSLLLEYLKGLIVRLSGNFFVFQTPVSQQGFCRKFLCSRDRTAVISNAIGLEFANREHEYQKWDPEEGDKTVLCPSAYYSHKNIELLFRVAENLVEKGVFHIKFLLTINGEVYETLLSKYPRSAELVRNHGPFKYSSALSVYKHADAVIMPSLLETFSTVYVEAMALGLPIFLPKEEFAIDICGEYGIYYESKSSDSLFDVLTASEDESKAEIKKVLKSENLARYGTQENRYQAFVTLFHQVLDGAVR